MKTWIVLIAVLGLGFGGYSVWNRQKEKQAAQASTGRPTTAMAEARDINFAVNAAGEIGPAEQVSVRPEINGRIEQLPVDLGDRVKKTDLLFKLDDRELQQERASTLTAVDRAELELQKADRDHRRAVQLLEDRLIAQELYDDTKTIFELAKNSLDRAKKDLSIIDERLTKTEVRAPFDCTILTRPVSNGQAVSGSGGFNSGTEVLTIADLTSMVINAHVNQADVPRLRVGETVEVAVEAVAGLKVNGTVERVAPQATLKNNIKGFAARIVLRNVDPRVRPGMTANIKIPVASAANVIAVPLSAVYTEKDPESGMVERFVYVQDGESFEKRNVKVGVSDYFFAEIQDGLKSGESVALEMPKQEREKKTHELASRSQRSGESAGSGANASGGNTNATAGAASPGTPRPASNSR